MFKLVSFAQKKGYLVEEANFIKTVKEKINEKYHLNLKTGNKFYKFLEDKDLQILKKFEHRVCFNLKQKPTYLFLTTYQNQKFCLYFDNQVTEIISIKHRFDEDLYNDTLIEGELVKVSQQHYIYLVSDLLVKNSRLNTEPLEQKLRQLEQIVTEKHRPDPGFDPCQILVKDFVEYRYLDSFLTDYLKTVPYQQYVGGLIFRPVVKSNRNLILVLNKNNFHQITIPSHGYSHQKKHNPIISTSNDTRNYTNSNISNVNKNKNTVDQTLEEIDNTIESQVSQPDLSGGSFSVQSLLHKFQQKDQIQGQYQEPSIHTIHTINTAESNSNHNSVGSSNAVADQSQVSVKKKAKIDYKKHKEVNFEIRKTDMPDVYQLWLLDDQNQPFKYGIASVPSRESSETVKSWFDAKSNETGSNTKSLIVVCTYIKTFGKWNPLRISNQSSPDKIVNIMRK